MQVNVLVGAIQEMAADAIVVNLFEGVDAPGGATGAVDAALDGAIAALLATGDFTGASGTSAVLYTRGKLPAERVILVGLGPREEFSLEQVRRAAAEAALQARKLNVRRLASVIHGAGAGGLDIDEAAYATVEGSLLALYEYAGRKRRKDEADSADLEQLTLAVFDPAQQSNVAGAVQQAEHVVAGVTLARDLVNMPPNFCTPAYMADTATRVGEEVGLRVQVLERGQMQALGMGALLAVAQGSETPPRFIIMEHNASRAEELPSIVLVGKGITFDTGGYNLKTGEGMSTMKLDMAGGAAVIGAMRAIGGLDLPLHVVGLVPAADNMISGRAYRPQEVVTASNGTTIEVVSTDAEGRMLLADALVFAARFQPEAVVDVATLTGACVVALGRGIAAGLFSTSERIRDTLLESAAYSGEKLWPMPLFKEYEKSLESDVADLKHSGGKGGGVGTSATFLKHFTSYPWAHVDMAGMAADLKDVPYMPSGASGFGVRLLVDFCRRWQSEA
ncbi:MAG: leucyl aminopeptidase [Anaerolineae bacterium]